MICDMSKKTSGNLVSCVVAVVGAVGVAWAYLRGKTHRRPLLPNSGVARPRATSRALVLPNGDATLKQFVASALPFKPLFCLISVMNIFGDCTHDYPDSVPSPVLPVREPLPLNSAHAEHTSVNPKKPDSSLVTLLDLFSLFILSPARFQYIYLRIGSTLYILKLKK